MDLNMICAFLMFPALSLLLYQNYQENTSLNKQVATHIQIESKAISTELSGWLANYMNAVGVIAQLDRRYGLKPSVQLQEELGRINKLFPDFHNLYLGNKSGTTVAFYPSENEKGESTIGLNFADRPYFKQLVETGTPVISDVFSGRGGVFEPIFILSSPVMKDGRLSHFALGAINLDRMCETLKNHARQYGLVVTLLDSKRNIIFSSDATRKSLDKLPEMKVSDIITAVPDVFLRVPGVKKNAGFMQVWKNAYYFSTMPVSGTNWTIQVDYTLMPMQKQLYASAIRGLSVIALLFLPMICIAIAFSRYLTDPLLSLARISADIPSRIEKNEEIAWPTSNIAEVAMLVDNFQLTSEALGSKIGNLAQRLSLAADAAKIGVWDYYIPENKLIWDKWMYALYGMREEDFLGTYEAWQDGLHPDDKVRGDVEINQAIQGEKEFDTEFRVVWPSGEIRHIKAHALITRDVGGKALRMIGINYDISHRKQAEKELLETNRQLNKATAHANNMASQADKANRTKSEFLANMSHELRTPLNAIIGFSQVLENKFFGDLTLKQEEYVKDILDSGKHLLTLINDILDLAKVESGKMKLALSIVSVKALLDRSMLMIEEKAHKHGIGIQLEISDDVNNLEIQADEIKLKQILFNSFSNAAKFTPDGGTIRAFADITTDPEPNLRIRIADTGIGIAKEDLETIFKPFCQVQGDFQNKTIGSGLGLPISRQLVELHGGRLWAESDGQGKGSTFGFTLPLGFRATLTDQDL